MTGDLADQVKQLKNAATLASRQRQEALSLELEALKMWSDERSKEFESTFQVPHDPDTPSKLQANLMGASETIRGVDWLTPITDLVRHLIPRLREGEKAALQEEWTNCSNYFEHASCPPLGKVPPLPLKVCYYAGFCMCVMPDRLVRRFEGRMRAVLRSLCKPKSGGRQSLTDASLVLRFRREGA